MSSRPVPLTEATTITLKDGVQLRTQYDSIMKRHIVNCDLCNAEIRLAGTANTFRFELHRKACKQREEKSIDKKFRISEHEPDVVEDFGFHLLFRPASASIDSQTRTQVNCPGQWVQWSPGSIWETYPFRLHKTEEVGWTPISFDEASNGLVIRVKRCWKRLEEIDSEDPSPCFACKQVPHSVEFRNAVERAQNVKEHTPWMYLTDQQKERLMRQMAMTIRRLRTQVNNSHRSRRVLSSRVHEYKRIMMLIASNDIPRLTKLLSVSLRHGSSATTIATQIQRAVDGLYSPRGGFTQRELDVAFLCQAIGGRRLLYALGKSHGLPSETTVRRNQVVPRLLPSIGVPTAKEIEHNISAFFDPTIKPPPVIVNGTLPGNILGFDGVSIQKKCRYCPKRGVVLGLCREHSQNIDTHVTDFTVIGKIWDALEAHETDSKVCWGTEATAVVVAPYSRNTHYSPTPLVLSPTDKSETGDRLAEWIQTVIDTWNIHENGAIQHGPLWSIASDGDATFRRARHELCNRYRLDSESQLGRKLQPLLGFNLYTSKESITATCDPKHIFKRFATLLRSTGMTVKDSLINSSDIRDQLIKCLGLAPNEVNDILDTQDKQNVPKAVKLLRYLDTLKSVPPPVNEFSRLRYDYISFIAKLFSCFVEPFIDVRMNLGQQLESLSTFAHIAVALQLEHGAAFLPGPLYADSQAIIKNIYFVVARLQLIGPDLTFHLIHEGTDRLERLFGDCRTLDHGRNFDILQLSEKMAIATLINSTFECNPDLDRGHRRLDLSSTIGVDHVNPSSWLGDTRVGGLDLTEVWNKGRVAAVDLLESLFGVDKVERDFNFQTIFSHSDRDMLRPKGTYVGVRDRQLGEDTHIPVTQKDPILASQPTPSSTLTMLSGNEDTSSISDIDEDLGLEEDLPDDPCETLKTLQTFLVEGKEMKIDSAISSIHPRSWRQMSDRIYRVRGWSIDQFNTSKVEGLVDADDAVNEELLKVYDIVGFLARVDDSFSDITSVTSDCKVLGQILKLVPSEKQVGYWEWAREYVLPANYRGKKQSLTTEIASQLIHPLTVNIVSYPSEPKETRLRWAISADELQRSMQYAWDILSPEMNNSFSNFESIPIIKSSDSLPYRNKNGQKSFVMRNVPNEFLDRNVPLSPKHMVHCLTCGDVVQLSLMRGHVGKHILWDMRFQIEMPSSNSDLVSSIGVMPCGFCGLDDCITYLISGPDGAPSIISDCVYHDKSLDYHAASRGEANSTICSNIPIHCSLCPQSPEGKQPTIWKYNALMHILVDHGYFDSSDRNLCIVPDVPILMQAKMHIPRAEEMSLGIEEERTMEARADYHLLNSDDFQPESDVIVGKRMRADTQSTIQSTIRPPFKKHHI